MPESMVRVRSIWNSHGSWVLLLVIGISCFMAGSQFTAVRVNDQFRMMIEAHDRQDAERIKRINRLMDDNKHLSLAINEIAGRVTDKAGQAADAAQRAAETATEAVSKAGETSNGMTPPHQ